MKRKLAFINVCVTIVVLPYFLMVAGYLSPSITIGLTSYCRTNHSGRRSEASCSNIILYKKPPRRVDSTTTTPTEEDGSYPSFGNSTEDNRVPANLKRKVKARRDPLGHIVPKDIRKAQAGGTANPRLRPQGVAREAGLNNPSNLKILGGSAKGKRLDSPGKMIFIFIFFLKKKEEKN